MVLRDQSGGLWIWKNMVVSWEPWAEERDPRPRDTGPHRAGQTSVPVMSDLALPPSALARHYPPNRFNTGILGGPGYWLLSLFSIKAPTYLYYR